MNYLINILNYLSGATLILSFLILVMCTYKLSASLGVITIIEGEINKKNIDNNNKIYKKEKIKVKDYRSKIQACVLLGGISAIINVIVHLLE